MSNNTTPSEADEQKVFIQWLRIKGLRFHHSPNETGSSPEAHRRAIRMKQQGASPGFPDLIVVIQPGQSHDGQGYILGIEMKRQKNSTTTPAQKDWIAALNSVSDRVRASVCKGSVAAIQFTNQYLKESTEVF